MIGCDNVITFSSVILYSFNSNIMRNQICSQIKQLSGTSLRERENVILGSCVLFKLQKHSKS